MLFRILQWFELYLFGNNVTSIGVCAFSYCSGLSSVNIPNTVTSIGSVAFMGCSKLTTITIGNGLNTIGSSSFADCPKITDVFCYAEDVPIMKNFDNGKLTTDAFVGSQIENVTLHVPTSSVGMYQSVEPWKNFKEVIPLTNDDPKPSDDIESGTCGGNLTWTYSKSTKTLTISGTGEMWDYEIGWNWSLINPSPWYGYRKEIENIIFEDGITSIGDYAFLGCNIKELTLPNSIITIGREAFSWCYELMSIEIPNNVTTIKESAFRRCTSANSIKMGKKATTIGREAFKDCEALVSIEIPNSVISVEPETFAGCTGLTSITIPESTPSRCSVIKA